MIDYPHEHARVAGPRRPGPTRRVTSRFPRAVLHYADEGTGDTVVLVHGTPTWSLLMRAHAIPAALKGALTAWSHLDHLGFGLSDRPSDAGYAPETTRAVPRRDGAPGAG